MKITYLFGAGASKHCLPIVNEIPERIERVISLLEKPEFQLSDRERFDIPKLDASKLKMQETLIDDLRWVVQNAKNHASIDTFAKKLFLKEQEEEFMRLKACFSVYLIIEQIINKPDKRYDGFYASILEDEIIGFPKNLRLLSWNYDNQFEISFSEYSGSKSLKTNGSYLGTTSKYTINRLNNTKLSLIKLNGSANLLLDEVRRNYYYLDEILEELSKEALDAIIRNYALICFGGLGARMSLSFAWERIGAPENDIVEHAKHETADTEVLVVIGYSFPYFNRGIDREIIGNMKGLRKVYFQAPDADLLVERFQSIRDDLEPKMLVPRFDLEQFLLPNEM